MGKGEIVGNLGDGKYSLRILKNKDRLQSRILDLEEQITEFQDNKLPELESARDEAEINFYAKHQDLTQTIENLTGNQGDEDAMDAVRMAKKEYMSAYKAYLKAKNKVIQANLMVAQKEKEKARLQSFDVTDPEVEAWCADYSPELTGEVGTIEIPGERQHIQIRPGHFDDAAHDGTRDGQLFALMSLPPSGTYYNLAMMPGWQKWVPIYRKGIVSNLDKLANTCTVTLDSETSSQQSIPVNKSSVLDDVPFKYMQCDAYAFKDGDDVVVEFMENDWDNPRVIGFVQEPRSCQKAVYFKVQRSDGPTMTPDDFTTSIVPDAYQIVRDTETIDLAAYRWDANSPVLLEMKHYDTAQILSEGCNADSYVLQVPDNLSYITDLFTDLGCEQITAFDPDTNKWVVFLADENSTGYTMTVKNAERFGTFPTTAFSHMGNSTNQFWFSSDQYPYTEPHYTDTDRSQNLVFVNEEWDVTLPRLEGRTELEQFIDGDVFHTTMGGIGYFHPGVICAVDYNFRVEHTTPFYKWHVHSDDYIQVCWAFFPDPGIPITPGWDTCDDPCGGHVRGYGNGWNVCGYTGSPVQGLYSHRVGTCTCIDPDGGPDYTVKLFEYDAIEEYSCGVGNALEFTGTYTGPWLASDFDTPATTNVRVERHTKVTDGVHVWYRNDVTSNAGFSYLHVAEDLSHPDDPDYCEGDDRVEGWAYIQYSADFWNVPNLSPLEGSPILMG